MLIHGARSAILASKAKKDQRSRWIQGIVDKRGMNVAAIALANKNARIAMSLLLSGESCQKAA
jgi:transposase